MDPKTGFLFLGWGSALITAPLSLLADGDNSTMIAGIVSAFVVASGGAFTLVYWIIRQQQKEIVALRKDAARSIDVLEKFGTVMDQHLVIATKMVEAGTANQGAIKEISRVLAHLYVEPKN